MEDCIIVSQMEVLANVGVTERERAVAQRLTISLWLAPVRGLGSLGDAVENTVDYAAVCEAVKAEVGARPRGLIETVAEEIGGLLLRRFPLKWVEVEVRKYVLPEAEYVAVRIRRDG